ncbi:MAG: PQQ-binding-like beta-propeller repeat protein [Aureliella sp.]
MHASTWRSVSLFGSFFIIGFIATGGSANAEDTWPGFRGPTADGHAASTSLPTTWSEELNITWKVPVPGQGHSSPVVADGKIWLTTAVTSELTEEQKKERLEDVANLQSRDLVGGLSLRAVCFDLHSGKQLYDIEAFAVEKPEPIHHTNSYASPTPVTHDGRLYAHFGSYGTAAIDCKTGKVLWRNSELKVDHQNGPGSSPILWQDLLIANFDGIDQQFIAALHIEDGKLAWKTDRSGELNPTPDMKKAYATPIVVETKQGSELVSPGADWVYGYDPRTGSELWKASYGELGYSTVPCPVVGHGMAYICTSFDRSRLLAVKLGGQGDVSKTHVVWSSDSQIPKKPSLLLSGKELLCCNDTGVLTCFDALDGQELWRARVGGNFAASPILAGGLVYLFDEEGKTTVIKAGREFVEVSVNELAEGCNASPAIAGDAFIVRTSAHLYRIEN